MAANYSSTPGYQAAPAQYVAPPGPPQAPSAAQVGEQYRAELFAQCAKGIHEPQRKYGVCGMITAIVLFPCGLICLFSDSTMVCSRCGVTVDTSKAPKN